MTVDTFKNFGSEEEEDETQKLEMRPKSHCSVGSAESSPMVGERTKIREPTTAVILQGSRARGQSQDPAMTNDLSKSQQFTRTNLFMTTLKQSQKFKQRASSITSFNSFENYQASMSIANANQQAKLRADKAQFEYERSLFTEKHKQVAEELQDAETR